VRRPFAEQSLGRPGVRWEDEIEDICFTKENHQNYGWCTLLNPL
jgi:hypothetical protein